MRNLKGLDAVKRFLFHTFGKILKVISYASIGGCVVLVGLFVWYLNGRPDLEVWHEAALDAEFTVDSAAHSFEDYLALEAQLFGQLEKKVYDRTPAGGGRQIGRFHRGSSSDPGRWETDWNRTFQLQTEKPAAGVSTLR